MQPRMRPISPYQSPGGYPPPALASPGPGTGVGQSPGITPYPVRPIGPMQPPMFPYEGSPMGIPGMPVNGGPLKSPMDGNSMGGLQNLMALRSMMQRTPYPAY
jgi:hypothetical protein